MTLGNNPCNSCRFHKKACSFASQHGVYEPNQQCERCIQHRIDCPGPDETLRQKQRRLRRRNATNELRHHSSSAVAAVEVAQGQLYPHPRPALSDVTCVAQSQVAHAPPPPPTIGEFADLTSINSTLFVLPCPDYTVDEAHITVQGTPSLCLFIHPGIAFFQRFHSSQRTSDNIKLKEEITHKAGFVRHVNKTEFGKLLSDPTGFESRFFKEYTEMEVSGTPTDVWTMELTRQIYVLMHPGQNKPLYIFWVDSLDFDLYCMTHALRHPIGTSFSHISMREFRPKYEAFLRNGRCF